MNEGIKSLIGWLNKPHNYKEEFPTMSFKGHRVSVTPASITVPTADRVRIRKIFYENVGRYPTLSEIIGEYLRENPLRKSPAKSTFANGSSNKNKKFVRVRKVTLDDGRIIRIPVL